MKIAIASDHAGFIYKAEIIKKLSNNYEIKDFGTDSLESVDYPDFVHPICRSIVEGEYEFGVLLCGSGNGVAITANKHASIRAALCWENELALLARSHNNANIICIPARFVSIDLAISMVEIFLQTQFEGGRHENRVKKISII